MKKKLIIVIGILFILLLLVIFHLVTKPNIQDIKKLNQELWSKQNTAVSSIYYSEQNMNSGEIKTNGFEYHGDKNMIITKNKVTYAIYEGIAYSIQNGIYKEEDINKKYKKEDFQKEALNNLLKVKKIDEKIINEYKNEQIKYKKNNYEILYPNIKIGNNKYENFKYIINNQYIYMEGRIKINGVKFDKELIIDLRPEEMEKPELEDIELSFGEQVPSSRYEIMNF